MGQTKQQLLALPTLKPTQRFSASRCQTEREKGGKLNTPSLPRFHISSYIGKRLLFPSVTPSTPSTPPHPPLLPSSSPLPPNARPRSSLLSPSRLLPVPVSLPVALSRSLLLRAACRGGKKRRRRGGRGGGGWTATGFGEGSPAVGGRLWLFSSPRSAPVFPPFPLPLFSSLLLPPILLLSLSLSLSPPLFASREGESRQNQEHEEER